jgi:small subunit ribosomal protein S16
MVKLRLRRMGANNQPFYRIVAVDARVSRDGKYIECIGWYDPKPTPSKINIETDRALYWLGVGAQPSDTVRSLFRKAGILQIRHENKVKDQAESN